MKYGVISRDALVDDLRSWSSFYIGGRMHKPVAMIDGFGVHGRTVRVAAAAAGKEASMLEDGFELGKTTIAGGKITTQHVTKQVTQPEDDELFRASEDNLQNALTASLLLLPEKFTEQTLYETIAGLSYAGDFRMSIAENPDKVKNIVRNGGSPARFRKLYMRSICASELRGYTCTEDCESVSPELVELYQNVSAEARAKLLLSLPFAFRRRMAGHINSHDVEEERVNEELTQRLFSCSDDQAVSQLGAGIVSKTLKEIVSQTALQQTMKGLISAGVVKSAVYSYNKIGKRLRL